MITAPGPRLRSIVVRAGEPQQDTLIDCLRAIFRAFERDEGRISAAAHARILAVGGQRLSLSHIHELIHDIARDGSLDTRELHPPQAAPIPEKPPEFDLHWHDSYLPFVRSALKHDEPVLAYRGWPAGCGDWGIITSIDEEDTCSGQTPAGATAMVSPALLAYVFSEQH